MSAPTVSCPVLSAWIRFGGVAEYCTYRDISFTCVCLRVCVSVFRGHSHNMHDILRHLLNEEQLRRLVFSWHNGHCDKDQDPLRPRKNGATGKNRIIFRKNLEKVWGAYSKYNVRRH